MLGQIGLTIVLCAIFGVLERSGAAITIGATMIRQMSDRHRSFAESYPAMLRPRALSAALLAACFSPAAHAQQPEVSVTVRFAATEARQGVAADATHVYVNANSAIGKYDKRTGRRVAAWSGDPAWFVHMNSCAVVAAELVCAASNYPAVPMASSIEYFSLAPLKHVRSRSLGPGRGSLTWLDWHDDSWWAAFANYDGKGGEPGRDHRATTLVRFDTEFREQGAWLFPPSVLERFKPYSSSGGAWGSDDLLYVTGHDRPEIYALRLPEAGSRLVHVATLPLATSGQAIDWDPDGRVIWSVDRAAGQVVAARVPPVEAAE